MRRDGDDRGDGAAASFLAEGPPYYTYGDVEMLYRAAAEGVHVVTLSRTDAWSGAFARRLGFKYDGVLTINGPDKGGVTVPNCPKLFEGLPQKPRGDYSFDWTGRFEALEDLAFTACKPKWDKKKGTNNYCGYAGFSARLAGSDAFSYAYTNAVGSVDAHCYGDVSPRIDVYAKSKRTGDTTRLSFIADLPTTNYTLHQPMTYNGAGFYFIAFPEMFNKTLEMPKGEKRDFHYVLEVAKPLPMT